MLKKVNSASLEEAVLLTSTNSWAFPIATSVGLLFVIP
jgi:hypothetical protein